jgi:hypothetical protein
MRILVLNYGFVERLPADPRAKSRIVEPLA